MRKYRINDIANGIDSGIKSIQKVFECWMIRLKFKNANTVAYSIVEIENKKYLMDLGSMRWKHYSLGLQPNLITLDIIELTPSDDSFDIKSKTKIGTTTISIMVQLLDGLWMALKSRD